MPVVLRCPACREKFKYDVSEGWPDLCPLCKADINNRRADDDVVMPNIFSIKSKNNDAVARQIMDGSETRMNLAAAMAGGSPEDFSSLKITNLNDRNDAEVAAMPVSNAVSQHMDAMAARGLPTGFGAGANGSEYASGTATGAIAVNGQVIQGIAPRAGINALAKTQRALGRGI